MSVEGWTRFVIVDCETTSLDTNRAVPLEIVATEYDGSVERGSDWKPDVTLVPHVSGADLAVADRESLAVNRYYERRVFRRMTLSHEMEREVGQLAHFLGEATLVGANPAYDAEVLARFLRPYGYSRPWHHRLFDVEAATMAVKGLDRVPSLKECADLWEIERDESAAHTAFGDVCVTLDVFHAIRGAK